MKIGIDKIGFFTPHLYVDMAKLAQARNEDPNKYLIGIVATESGVDNSKSTAAYVSELLGLSHEIRTIELKQACYAATAGLQLAKGHIALAPDKKALVIGSDIARYGLKTPGEPTQGGGAVAMLVSKDPKLVTLEAESFSVIVPFAIY